jgi:hypothetical protein
MTYEEAGLRLLHSSEQRVKSMDTLFKKDQGLSRARREIQQGI